MDGMSLQKISIARLPRPHLEVNTQEAAFFVSRFVCQQVSGGGFPPEIIYRLRRIPWPKMSSHRPREAVLTARTRLVGSSLNTSELHSRVARGTRGS
jgi:hypothetical protein